MSSDPSADSVLLIQRMKIGDREAFGRFYDRYASLVFTFAMRIVRLRSEAEDLLQEVFFQVWRQAAHYSQDRGSPEAWILTITRSRALNKLRLLRRMEVSNQETSAGESGRMENAESDAKIMVEGALAQLPETQRTALELAYFDGLTQTEVAARLGEPLGTVKTRMRDGLARLRGLMGVNTSGGFP